MPNLTRKEAFNVTVGICERLRNLGAEYCFSSEFRNEFGFMGAEFLPVEEAVSWCDAVIAIGGDGSIIHAAKLAVTEKKPILGINAGRLAFMAGLEDNELNLLSRLIDGDYTLDKRLLLKTKIIDADGNVTDKGYCVNDCLVTNEEKQRMTAIDVALDGKNFNSYLCDGVLVSTPTGSTAYSLSAGGPLVMPGTAATVITVICPHALASRPIVVSDNTKITLRPTQGETPLILTIDGEELATLSCGDTLDIRKSDRCAKIAFPPQHNNYQVLSRKLGWTGTCLPNCK